jgi:hypothetical protein
MSAEKDLRKYKKVDANITLAQGGTPGNPLYVNVVNQIDLSTIESLLNDIKDFAQSIDENTDTLEAKLDTINISISNGFSVNHSDLLNIITELQELDANTDGIESQLTQIITGIAGNNQYADNTIQLNGNANAASFLFANATTTRKQVIIVNKSTKKLWISRNNPAVVGEGIPLAKDEIYIEDVYRGALYGIFESGTGNLFTFIQDTV